MPKRGIGKMKPITVNLPEWMVEGLKKIHETHQISISEIVRMALLKHFKELYPELTPKVR